MSARLIVTICAVLSAWPACAARAQSSAGADLEVIVLDPSGARVPHALVTIERQGSAGAPAGETLSRQFPVSAAGVVVASGLEPGLYTIDVRAAGFEPARVLDVRLVARRTARHVVRLALAQVTASVEVGRDRQSEALDPRGFSTFLSAEQIEALPDDPEALAHALREMAPPGAVLRIDGFTGGLLPPKSQILSIRIPRLDTFAAQDHGGVSGLSFIDIVTRPGGGSLQGSGEAAFRNSALNARNPMARERTPESLNAGGLALDGPIVSGRSSFAFAVRVASQRESATIRAALPDGVVRVEPVVRPQQTMTLSGRVAASLPGDQTVRVSVSSEQRRGRNLGAGDFNLPERAYRSSGSDLVVRTTVGGRLGRRGFAESRAQLRWAGGHTLSDVEAPTVRVLDAFSSGGAQATGGSRSFELLAASDVDYARGAHAWRAGILVETGRYHSNRRANYLGTFTFASLDDYVAQQPSTFTQRIGDARVKYNNVQGGLYLQDDFRIARSALLSYGIRYEQQGWVDAAPAWLPRLSLAWSPFRSGHTTVRAGWGLFADWLSAAIYEQSIVVDGVRQHDVLLIRPSYPDPNLSGEAGQRERYRLADGLALPGSTGVGVGIERHLAPTLRVYASYGHRSGRRLLRGHDLNPLVDGSRLDPASGSVVEVRNDGASRVHTVVAQAVRSSPRGWIDASAAYVLTAGGTNTAGPFSIPAGRNADEEWGPTAPSHAATATTTARVRGWLIVTLSGRWRSGVPYTITSGRDDNGDGLFTDRPEGVARNSARTEAAWDVGVRLSFVRRFGRVKDFGAGLPSAGGDVQSTRAGSVASSGGLADATDRRRYRLEIFAATQNLTNRPEYVAASGVRGSPFFGQPTMAINPRRVDIGVRVGF
jgi:hypothetical protein